MTFNELATEVITTRFNESMRARIKRWINVCEQKIWDAEDWPFKYVTDQALTVTANTQTINTSSITDFNRPITLLDQDGVKIVYLTNREWDDQYADDLSFGEPVNYTMVNRTIYLGPTPNANATFTCRYERVYAHLNSSGVITPGLMNADNDTPIWDAAYHFALVVGALSLGLRLSNDPTWEPLELEYQEEIARMRNHYMPPRLGNRSYAGAEAEAWQ